MAFEVVISRRAEHDLEIFLELNKDRYSAQLQLLYPLEIRALCQSLENMPRRFERVRLRGKIYRKARYKAHIVYYH